MVLQETKERGKKILFGLYGNLVFVPMLYMNAMNALGWHGYSVEHRNAR